MCGCTSRGSRRRRPSSSSTRCRAPRPARSRSSSCARRNGPGTAAGFRVEGNSHMLADDTYDEDVLGSASIGTSLGTDYFGLRDELTDSERDYLQRARSFVDGEVLPVINGYWERAEFPWELIEKLGSVGIVGDGLEGYGCPSMSPVAAGLINMELNRGDGSLGTFHAVQAGLAMRSIHMLGSEEQKQRWLPAMARLEKLGAFALTEPRHGADAGAPETIPP